MGAVISLERLEEAGGNALLIKLAGPLPMDSNDPQWNKLFSFNFNLDQRNKKVQAMFLEQVGPLMEQLLHNTRETGNFATLVQVLIRRCAELETSAKCENKIFLWQTANALLILRFVSAFFAQRLSPREFANVFGERGRPAAAGPGDGSGHGFVAASLAQQLADVDGREGADGLDRAYESVAEQLLANLVHILTHIPVSQLTLQLHAETVRVLLALLSTQLYEEAVSERSEFLRLLMLKFRPQSGDLVCALLENFLHHQSEQLDWDGENGGTRGEGNGGGSSSSSSLVISLWSSLQRALGGSLEGEEGASARFPPQSLACLSLSLLLSLVYYPAFGGRQNPFKQMLSIFQNAQEVSSLANLEASFKLDFSRLYARLCLSVHGQAPQPLLLLYLLVHNNLGFRNFVLSRINLEQLVLPVARVLHDGMCGSSTAPGSPPPSPAKLPASSSSSSPSSPLNTHQIYLALIVLLMLSEDDFFKKVIHEMTLKNVDWYQPERAPIAEITLGGLLVLVFAKTIQVNTVRVRDRYFHVNSLATLANLSPAFKQLSPLVCQKLIGLLETMTKRHAKLIRLLRENAEREQPVEERRKTEELGEGMQEANDDLHRDITALEEGIRTVLEIVNACLCHNLRNNPDLVYTVLYKRELFEQYHQHPMFQDLVWNIYAVINHFTARVEALVRPSSSSPHFSPSHTSPSSTSLASTASVADILEAIKKTAIEWPTDRLKKFPELRFKYIEDENTLDFFIPYIWRLVQEGAGIHFDSSAIQLFPAASAGE